VKTSVVSIFGVGVADVGIVVTLSVILLFVSVCVQLIVANNQVAQVYIALADKKNMSLAVLPVIVVFLLAISIFKLIALLVAVLTGFNKSVVLSTFHNQTFTLVTLCGLVVIFNLCV